MKTRALISRERQINTYVEMWHGSRILLLKGLEDKKGSHWQFMASLTFAAFTLEAYLNHIGAKLLQCWEDVESLSPLKKLNLLCEKLDLKIDYSKPPYQTVKELFRFRNDIAHGKTIKLKSDNQIRRLDDKLEAYMRKPLLTTWEKFSTEHNARRVRADIDEIIHELHGKANIKDDPAFFPGMALSSLDLIESEDNS